MKIVSLLSGGIDSTILLFRLVKNNHDVIPLFVNYGQKAYKKEFEAATKACKVLKLKLNIIDISGLSSISSGLTSKKLSPIKNPVFPNRNLILLTVASAFSVNKTCHVIAIGITNNLDFADQTKKFVQDAEKAISHGRNMTILSPMIELNKLEVIRLAKENNIPLDFTYSCHFGSVKHCGKCLNCKDRIKVFRMEGIT